METSRLLAILEEIQSARDKAAAEAAAEAAARRASLWAELGLVSDEMERGGVGAES